MKLSKLISLFFISLLLSGCADLLNPDWSKKAEPDGKKRARENVEKGKGISMLYGGKKGTNFQFASSNPLWRASLDTLDFMVLSTVDYAGGLIISDWYSENNPNEYDYSLNTPYYIKSVKKEIGTITIFPSFMPHRVSRVTKGVRKSLVLWVGGCQFK